MECVSENYCDEKDQISSVFLTLSDQRKKENKKKFIVSFNINPIKTKIKK